MNRNLQGAMSAFFLFALIVAALIFLPPGYLPTAKGPATATPQDTLTATSTNTVFTAHIKFDTACRSGPGEDHEMVEKVEQDKDMMLIAKDKEPPEWLLIRPGGLDCWVEKRFVTSYDIASVDIFPTQVPSTSTPLPTITLPPTKTVTSTPSRTKVVVTSSATRTRRPSEGSNTPAPPNTTVAPPKTTVPPPKTTVPPNTTVAPPRTTVPPPNTTVAPPKTTVPPPNTTVAPPTTDPPHRACNDGVDNDGDGYKDGADPQCKNNGDDDESQ